MADFLTDSEIDTLIKEPKTVSSDFRSRLQPKPKRGHSQVDVSVNGTNGSQFKVYVRKSSINSLDFSVILVYLVPGSSQVLRLRRYNGKSHQHSNPIEGTKMYDFHIHTATERYMRSGNREDTFAEVTSRYVNVNEAIDCLIEDCGFVLSSNGQGTLF